MEKKILGSTTIEQLYSTHVISTRTYNGLVRRGLFNVVQIMEFLESGNSVRDIESLGVKSEQEVDYIAQHALITPDDIDLSILRLPQTPDCLQNVFQSLFALHKDTEHWTFASAAELYDALESHDVLRVRLELTKEQNIAFRRSTTRFLEHLMEELSQMPGVPASILPHYEGLKQELESAIDSFSPSEELAFLPAGRRRYIQQMYEEMYATRLGARARKMIETAAPDCATMVALFGKRLPDYDVLCPGKYMQKTTAEIFHFNSQFKAEFDKAVHLGPDEIRALELGKRYPYLLEQQRIFVDNFTSTYGYEPVFYLMYKFLRLTEDRNDKLRSQFFGLTDDKRHSMDELSATYKLSHERVRQIVVAKKIGTPYDMLPTGVLPEQYEWIVQQEIITEEHPGYKALAERENLPASFNAFACTVSMFTPHEVVDFKGQLVVFSPRVAGAIRVKWLREQLEAVLFAKYPVDSVVSIDEAMAGIPQEYSTQVRQMLLYLSTRVYGMKHDDEGNIYVPQNCINVEMELAQFLEEKGEPMTGEELLARFKQKYPNHKYTSVTQIKPYIFKSEIIGAIGKHSLYGLTSWKHLHYGTIRDLLEQTLMEADTPMTIDDLYSIVSDAIPHAASTKSLYVTMAYDDKNRFSLFEGDRFGLTAKTYPPSFKPLNVQGRQTFEERMANLRRFIKANHRYPAGSNDETEASLQRWLYNIQSGVVAIEPDKLRLLVRLLQSYVGKEYPKYDKKVQTFVTALSQEQ